ncbi:MAG: cytochrome C [Polyangiales bacterium]
MRKRQGFGWLLSATVVTTAAIGWFQGCGSNDDAASTLVDSGATDSGVDTATTTDSSTDDTGTVTDTGTTTDTGTMTDTGTSDVADGGGLSARAAAGLAASPFAVPTTGVSTADLEQIGMGSYIVNVVSSCSDCHNTPGKTLPAGFLAGGNSFGPVKARNLTSDATNGLRMTEAQFIETMQTGKDQKLSGADGGGPVALIVMPWQDYRWMSVTDLKAIYAYLKKVPADTNADVFGPSGGPPIPMPTTFTDGAAATAPTLPSESGDAPLFTARGRAVQVPVEPAAVASLSAADLAAYGRGAYLVAQAICGECHTNPERPSMASTKYNAAAWLTGGRVFAVPPGLDAVTKTERTMSANLLGATHGFINAAGVTETVFSDTITKHVHADETPPTRPLGFPMPAGLMKLVPEDVHAIWTYLKNQTPVTGAGDKATQDSAPFCSGTVTCPTGTSCTTASSECTKSTGCTKDEDCAACQTCNTGTGACVAPVTSGDSGVSTCVTGGI